MNMKANVEWRVRQANQDDADALAVIGAATFLESFSDFLDGKSVVAHCQLAHSPQVYRDYFSDGARAWLAEITPGMAPVGFALVGNPDLACAQDGDIELKRIYSFSRFHGSGIGQALMRNAIDAASGYQRLLLGVYAGNARAIAFYRKHGFGEAGVRQFDVGGTLYNDIVLALTLN